MYKSGDSLFYLRNNSFENILIFDTLKGTRWKIIGYNQNNDSCAKYTKQEYATFDSIYTFIPEYFGNKGKHVILAKTLKFDTEVFSDFNLIYNNIGSSGFPFPRLNFNFASNLEVPYTCRDRWSLHSNLPIKLACYEDAIVGIVDFGIQKKRCSELKNSSIFNIQNSNFKFFIKEYILHLSNMGFEEYNFTILLFDSMGKLIKSANFEKEIDLNIESKGFHFIKVLNSNRHLVYSNKFISN